MQSLNFILIFLLTSFNDYYLIQQVHVQENDIKLIYSTSERRDTYIKGDRLGEKIIVYFNGTVEKYATYNEDADVLLKRSYIFLREIDELNSLFSEYNFDDYPQILPLTNNLYWPASGCVISFASTEKESLIEVNIIALGAGSKYYPDGFFEFLNKLNEKLNSFIK